MDAAPVTNIRLLAEQFAMVLFLNIDYIPFAVQLLDFPDNADRVKLVYNLISRYDMFPMRLSSAKSAQLSNDYRSTGNRLYVQKFNKESLKYYNLAVVNAPFGSMELALAYGNRSAALCSMKKYDESLADISRALETGCDDSLKIKLLKRRAACEEAPRETKNDDLQEGRDRVFAPPSQTNPLIPCADVNLELTYEPDFGRCIIAKAAFKPGTVLAVEDPHTVHLHAASEFLRCYSCCKTNIAMIPCENCNFAMFCDKECQASAHNKFHKYDCPLMSLTSAMEFTPTEMFAMHLLIRARCEHASWEDLIAACNNAESQTEYHSRGFVECESSDAPLKIYDSKYYAPIHMLETHVSDVDAIEMFDKTIVASVLLNILKQFTDIFPSVSTDPNVDPSKYYDFAGGLILHHLFTSTSNKQFLESLVEDKDALRSHTFASGAYAFMSLLNHSCFPNAERVSVGTTMVLMALRPIKKGEQVFVNYRYHYSAHKYEARQLHFKYHYKFKCKCRACENRWPLYCNLQSRLPRRIKYFTNFLTIEMCSKLEKNDLKSVATILDKLYADVTLIDDCAPCQVVSYYQAAILKCWSLFGNFIHYVE